ncbi:hypothetical protein NDU88_004595 [Pleurodeles waltl]|uniref:Uncharacterized protein n=1 Tax=Pleurodeles waltl TaxID=8319 RepID=A0AAV7SJD1_PLEWA|nr:hypothetical protein NDU88_004595 [Pleurodeles waltl]
MAAWRQRVPFLPTNWHVQRSNLVTFRCQKSNSLDYLLARSAHEECGRPDRSRPAAEVGLEPTTVRDTPTPHFLQLDIPRTPGVLVEEGECLRGTKSSLPACAGVNPMPRKEGDSATGVHLC